MPILAQYTIRSKQRYIFHSNRMIEIVGGSETVQDSFDKLYSSAKDAGLQIRQINDASFRLEEFMTGKQDAVELTRGGGNDTLLFRDRDTFRRTNAAFTRYLLERHPGLIPMCTGVEVEGKHYQADHHLLMVAVERNKNAMRQGRVENAQPFARQDRNTLQAIAVETRRGVNQAEYRTAEADAKYRKGLLSVKTDEVTRFLDDLAKEENQSLLAIVHADINRLGVKNHKKLKEIQQEADKQIPEGCSDYDLFVNAMRAFDCEIRDVVIKRGKAAVTSRQASLAERNPGEAERQTRVRWLVHEGDDITFICNAKYAMEYTRAYLEGVWRDGGGQYSACAGICVFHAHYPFYRAYELAEQACDNAKKLMHAANAEQAWVDFHYLRSGVNGDLEDIRALHRTQDCIARPWFVCGENPPPFAQRLERLQDLNHLLKQAGVARTQIKTLGTELEVSQPAGELVWRRLCYNTKTDLQKAASELFGNQPDALFRALYDLSDFYDLWFAREVISHGDASN